MAEHAVLSASSAERWMHCPGSVHMASMFPPSSSSSAEEGTLAHALAETMINQPEDAEKHREAVEAFYKANPDLNDSFKNMKDTLQPYVDFVDSVYQETLKRDASATLLTEQRVEFSEYVPGGFGTSDVVIIGAGCVTIIDLKYGKGVPISAKNNPQIRLYALGAINEYSLVYDFDRVRMVIYQPRLDKVTEEEMTVEDLQKWAKEYVSPAAKEALSDKPSYHPGEWCSSHFCPGVGACKARAEYALALERHSGRDPALLTDEEIADALGRVSALESWAKDLGKYALREALDGHPIPGWKIVEGISKRVYTDEDKVVDAAMKAGYDEALLYKRSLIGITDMEKLMGKKQFGAVLGGLVVKPRGAPKLTPESDPKPVYDPNKNLRDEFD